MPQQKNFCNKVSVIVYNYLTYGEIDVQRMCNVQYCVFCISINENSCEHVMKIR